MADFEGGTPVSIGGFIRQAIGEGMGVTAARNAMRESGVASMSNSAFGQLFGQIRAAVGGRDAIAALDYAAIPAAEAYTPWAAGAADKYASFVEVFVREIGTRTVTSRWHTFVTSEPHTPQEAVNAAIDVIAGGSEEGTTPSGETILDAVVTSMTRTVGR